MLPLYSVFSVGKCVNVSQLAVTGTAKCNKSQGKLASTRCILIRSILLSLCALFSPSPNTETLNLHIQIHQGPKVCMNALWDVHKKNTRWPAHTQIGCMQAAAWIPTGSWTYTHMHAHTSSPGVWKPNVKQTYGDSPHDPLPNHVEQTETVASAPSSNLLYMIYYTDTHRLSNTARVCMCVAVYELPTVSPCIWHCCEQYWQF